jgi:hypothetical protein
VDVVAIVVLLGAGVLPGAATWDGTPGTWEADSVLERAGRTGLTDLEDCGKTSSSACSRQGMTTNVSPTRHSCVGSRGPIDVVGWRRCRLLEYGFPPPLADELARQRVDLHALLQLVDRGCPPELAARILSPLEGMRR